MVKKNEYPKKSYNNGYRSSNSNRSYNYSNRTSYNRKNYGYNKNSRYSKPRADETVEDIKQDILRIEKEIKLELKEIRSMKLGI